MELNLTFKSGKDKRSSEPVPQLPPPNYMTQEQTETMLEKYFSASRTSTKVTTARQAMRISTAFRCTDILSGTIASLPFNIKRKTMYGNYVVDEDNELHYLLTRQASSRLTAYETMCNAIIQMLNQGNAYIFIKRSLGDVQELVLLANNSVSYDVITDTYVISDPINRVFGTYKPFDIIHIRNKSLDGGYTGVSTIQYAGIGLAVASAAESQSLQLFQNGGKVKGLVSGIKNNNRVNLSSLGDNQINDVAGRIEKQLASGANIVGISEDLTFSQMSITPADQQLMEQKKFSVYDLCRFYGVHPDMVFSGQAVNYKASEMAQIQFLFATLDPILCRIEAEYNSKLIARSVSNSYKFEFDRNYLFRTDIATQIMQMEKKIQYGVSTVNDYRIKEGEYPVKGGNTPFMSCNVAPIDSAKITGALPKMQ